MTNEETSQLKKDLDDAVQILTSSDWRVYKDFLRRRILKYQNKVNENVESGNLTQAQIALALMKDSQKLSDSFVQQVNQTKLNLKAKEQTEHG